MSNRRTALGLLAAVVVVTVALPAGGAPVEHCVVEVVDQKPDGEFVLSQPVCFKRGSDAFAYASGGFTTLEPGDSVQSPRAGGGFMSLSGSFALGIHYDGFNGTGSSITVMGSSCTGGWWNTSSAWDNRISSSYNGCQRLTHHDLPNKAGASESTTGSGTTDNLGGLNNQAESVSYWSS